MRRRAKEHVKGAPPARLRVAPTGTTREKVAWVLAREDWWDGNRDPDDPGWLPWIVDGWDQIDPLPWCGSVGAPCGDDDCMCVVWPEHRSIEMSSATAF